MTGMDIKPDAQGKVRDLYDLGDKLLLVATDRISAFDYILEDEIPHKGAVLTQLSCFWFELLDGVKMGSGSFEEFTRPSGSSMPHTVPCFWYSLRPLPAR